MARTKQKSPVKRDDSGDWMDQHHQPTPLDTKNKSDNSYTTNGSLSNANGKAMPPPTPVLPKDEAGIKQLIICAGGIYASFLTWAVLQERITTTPYGTQAAPEIFDFSIFLNTIQSALAATVGYTYLVMSSKNLSSVPAVFPSRGILFPLLLVAITSSLASPFGYASLKHVGYITFILAKSCKLLPVMALHVSVFRRRYPLYKYAVVALVTAGVAIFTLQHPSSAKKSSKSNTNSSTWGLFLLSINLLFDGLTNSTQDYINTAFAPYSGSQMMCANNILSTLLTSTYLLLLPYLAASPVAGYLGIAAAQGKGMDELSAALAFVSRNPRVLQDILMFAACGSIGQLFIFYTLAKFSSLVLVTITVTRKMLTMLLSVVWFRHSLNMGQWLGVALVFGGVGAEGMITRWEKSKKEKERAGAKKRA